MAFRPPKNKTGALILILLSLSGFTTAANPHRPPAKHRWELTNTLEE